MFDVFYSGPKPNLFAHEQEANSIQRAQQLSQTEYFWWITYLSDYSKFDFLYVPPPWQSQYTHVWPSQHHAYSGTYLVPRSAKTTDYHFHRQIIPNRINTQHYYKHVDCDFDWSWAPHPHDPPYIYVFGNQWWAGETMPTIEYRVPGATERKYIADIRAQLPERHDNHWHTIVDCDWDYSWQPDPGDPPYIYVFGNQWWPAEIMPTVEYHVPGATERKYMSWPRATLQENKENWEIPESIDANTIDYSWVPDPGDPPYIYQFPTQHQRTGGPVYTVPGATEVKYVDQIQARTSRTATAVYEIDHMDGNTGQIDNVVRRVRYFDNYRDTLIRLAKSIQDEHEFVWVCSSICDYTDFDFSWHPEQWQATMLHVFASDKEKFGDTFFMHVPTFAARAESKALLEWYDVNFVNISVPRRPIPVIQHNEDTHVELIKRTDWSGPLAVFSNGFVPDDIPTVPLWRVETKTIVPLSIGASSVIVPTPAKGHIRKQLYDYPYIDKSFSRRGIDAPLDIVFISNGEPNAQANWQKLVESVSGKNLNRIIRIDGINGRVSAYHAAANASQTPWFFAVFAKLEISEDFNWQWQPDRMQEPKHYIFHAHNPVNGLVYGHQAMIAYNRTLTLSNPGQGLDFTLDSAHEVVPILSGTAHYTDSPWMAWRTAFREVIKLRASLPDVESEYRLSQWLKKNNTNDYIKWSHIGAEDAVEYYESVNGSMAELRKSYDWAWLASYAFMRHNLTPDRQ